MPLTAAEREAKKTLHGEWRTPMPINFIDDENRTDANGKRYYRGEVRNQISMTVQKLEKKTHTGDVRIERHCTLYYYGRTEAGDVDYNNLTYQIEGKAGPNYDKIKWDNGCVWCRHGATAKDRDAIRHGKDKVIVEDPTARSAPPDWDAVDSQANARKVFQPAPRHTAAPPQWTFDEKVAEIKKVMMDQMAAVDETMEKRRAEKAAREQAQEAGPDREGEARAIRLTTQAVHAAAPGPEQEEDTEVAASQGKVLVPDGEHKMFCCGAMCGKNPAVMDDAEDAPLNPEDLPDARDMEKEGFFGPDELEDVIDRINDVVGVWGVSEETEREYIKPPVEALNKIVAACMSSFMNNPLMDLISYLMDEAMDFGVKCMKIGHYIKEHFVDPLCAALVDKLEDVFAAISWIKGQVTKVVLMMSQMVTDQVVSKTVEQIGDSDVVD